MDCKKRNNEPEKIRNSRTLKMLFIISGCILVAVVCALTVFYSSRLLTAASVERVSSYGTGYNLYQMNVKYDYSVERIIAYGITDNQTFVDAILKEALPLLPVHIDAPDFGCSVFCATDRDENVLMGRNYDFTNNTSAMLVRCTLRNGYKSIAFAALDNLSMNAADENIKSRLHDSGKANGCHPGTYRHQFF